MEHTLSGAATATRSRVYTFDQSSTFSTTASVAAADRAGNVQTVPFTVTRDITPPEVAIHVPASSGLVIPVTWSGQDTLSGLRHYTIRYSPSLTGPWTTWLTGTTATSGQFPGAADQTYYFQVETVDNVNNTATATAGPVTISAVTKYYYHGDSRVAMRQGDVVHFLHTDHLGSTSLTTDATGAPIAQTRYLPYGQQRWTDGETPTDFTFTGQRADSFGLLDYNARYYDSGLGRFISPDTIVPEPGNPQSLNRYSYALNNSLRYNDPSGHCPPSICQDEYGRPLDPYYRWGDRDYLNTLSLGDPNPWFVSQPGTVEAPNLKETIQSTLLFITPKTWHDEMKAGWEWSDQWGPFIEFGLSIAMMARGPSPMKGSGPVPGVLSVTPNSKSTKALQNYYPKYPIEFVFDPSATTFAVGKPKGYLGLGGSPHQQLATSIGADPDVVVGGMFSRGKDGRIITNEHSGHYWQNWTPEVRKQMVEFLENATGLPVDH